MINYKFEAYTVAGITILIAGLLRLYVYYKNFNISILPFLEPGEIGIIFFDNLLYFLLFSSLNIIVIMIFYKGKFSLTDSLEDKQIIKRLKNYGLFRIDKPILFLFLSIFLFWIYNVSTKIFLYEYFLWIILLLTALYVNPTIIFEVKRLLKKNNIMNNTLSIIFLVASLNLFVIAGFSGLNEAYKVKRLNYYKNTEFDIESSGRFISNENKFYIGKTKQFVFFYDRLSNETEVIPISKILRLKY